IYDWYWYDRRPFLEQCLNNGFLGAANNTKMKFYIMWANHNATYMWDKRNSYPGVEGTVVWEGAQDREQFEIIIKRIIENYFSRENYYKIDGKPVFSVFDTSNLIAGLGGVAQARHALDFFRAETVKAGHRGLHLQIVNFGLACGYAERREQYGACADIIPALGFDSMTHYNNMGGTYPIDSRSYPEIMDKVVAPHWAQIDQTCAIPYFPHVSVGWDNNIRYERLMKVVSDNTPARFEKTLLTAKDYLDKHPERARLITLNSWNEWSEGSYLQPDDLYGYGYLEAIRRVFL
ncbi:MAG: glycoside hydrolase family 99-like domain-containing protein, partial [Firmicutes bacterium]|nr:glycoside hydrolase family 99-like domain-containing protein [Bacillota bacterium]